jgi:hypothetical protein
MTREATIITAECTGSVLFIIIATKFMPEAIGLHICSVYIFRAGEAPCTTSPCLVETRRAFVETCGTEK